MPLVPLLGLVSSTSTSWAHSHKAAGSQLQALQATTEHKRWAAPQQAAGPALQREQADVDIKEALCCCAHAAAICE
jgi:hypothetical protein